MNNCKHDFARDGICNLCDIHAVDYIAQLENKIDDLTLTVLELVNHILLKEI